MIEEMSTKFRQASHYTRQESNNPPETLGKDDFPEKALQIPVQFSAVSPPIDPDLARVVDAWPGLPMDLKSAILALLDMAP